MYCLSVSWCVLSLCVCMGGLYIPPSYLAFSFSENLVVTVIYVSQKKNCYFSVLRLTFSDLSVVKNRFCCLFSVFTFLFRNCGSMMWDG